MATRIKPKLTKAVNILMKFTVLQRRYGTWMPVHEYYKFSPTVWTSRMVPPGKGSAAKPKYVCPGCEIKFTAMSMLDHRCQGGSEAWPKLDLGKYKRNQCWRPTSDFAPITYEDLK